MNTNSTLVTSGQIDIYQARYVLAQARMIATFEGITEINQLADRVGEKTGTMLTGDQLLDLGFSVSA